MSCVFLLRKSLVALEVGALDLLNWYFLNHYSTRLETKSHTLLADLLY